MRTQFLALCLAFALTPAFANAVLADVLLFPAANPGDVFSGTFSFSPATPLNSQYPQPPQEGFFVYGGTGALFGTMTVQLDGNTFAAGIDGSSLLSFNGTPINGLGAAAMSISLLGETSSTAILPLTLSSYNEGYS
jgi:hypothetical protein